MNKFEKNIKDAVEGYEAPYSAETWQSLNKAMGPSKVTLIKWIASSAALLALAVFGYSHFNTTEELITEELIAETVQNKESKAFIQNVENSVYDSNGKLVNEKPVTESSDFKLVEEEKIEEETNSITETSNESTPDENLTIEHLTPNNVSNITTIEEKEVEHTVIKTTLIAKVMTPITTQCISNEFTFTPSVPKQNAIYEWNLGDGTLLTGSVVSHNYTMAGNYSVELILRDRRTRAILETSPSVEITVLEAPNALFTEEQSTSIEPYTYFKNTSTNYKSILWEIENIETSTLENFEYSFKHKGRFTVNLTATNENGCSTTTSKVISVEQDYNLLAPTAFSPNGDNLNDNFMPKALPLMELPFTLTIYDRQGKLVYQTNDSSQPWDGQYTQEGIPAPNGVYVWVCQLTKGNGETEIYQSQVVIAK